MTATSATRATKERQAARIAARYSMMLGLCGALAAGGCSSTSNSPGGTGGAGVDAAPDVVDTAPYPCAGMAISFNSNVATPADPAKSRVMVDFGAAGVDTDLPLGNSPRTVEFWAFVLGSSWAGDANTMFEYGNQSIGNAGFGLDFGGTRRNRRSVHQRDLRQRQSAVGHRRFHHRSVDPLRDDLRPDGGRSVRQR